MNLHKNRPLFDDLCTLTATFLSIPIEAVKRDYYIVLILKQLANSSYNELCVFKGGTSLSKCYPNSIRRFSEDIDLTFVPTIQMTDKQYDKHLKNIEIIMSQEANLEKIVSERNQRNKSSYLWFDEKTRIKLEIGSSVRPDPYMKRLIKSYIQEFLEIHDKKEIIEEYHLEAFLVNALCIERTFIDKVLAIKRHAYFQSLNKKVRHIYDVVMLFEIEEIKQFLNDKEELKRIVSLTKQTDSFFLSKRNSGIVYNACEPYDFDSWKNKLDMSIKKRYESLHEDLLFTNEKQSFDEAISTLDKISHIFKEIEE